MAITIAGNDERILLTLDHAAALLDLSQPTIKRLIAHGQLRQIKVHGSTRIPRRELDRYISACWQAQHGGEAANGEDLVDVSAA